MQNGSSGWNFFNRVILTRWKIINAKPVHHVMPTLHIPANDDSVKLESTNQEKVAAISAISFPDKDDDPTLPFPKYKPEVPSFQPLCPRGLNETLSLTSNNSPGTRWNRLSSATPMGKA
jgi:hypothetical protein